MSVSLQHAPQRPSAPLQMSRGDLIASLRVKPETVDGWLSGSARRPPYFDAAVKAARAGLHPVPAAILRAYPNELGVKASHVEFWITANQVPYAARMAAAWIIHRRVTGRD